MKTPLTGWWKTLGALGGSLGLLALLNAQTLPQFTRVERLTRIKSAFGRLVYGPAAATGSL